MRVVRTVRSASLRDVVCPSEVLVSLLSQRIVSALSNASLGESVQWWGTAAEQRVLMTAIGNLMFAKRLVCAESGAAHVQPPMWVTVEKLPRGCRRLVDNM